MSDSKKTIDKLMKEYTVNPKIKPEMSNRFIKVTLPDELLEYHNINAALSIGDRLQQLQNIPQEEKLQKLIEIKNSCEEASKLAEEKLDLMVAKEEALKKFHDLLKKFLAVKHTKIEKITDEEKLINTYVSKINFMRRFTAFLNVHLAMEEGDEEYRIYLAKEVCGDLELSYYQNCLKQMASNTSPTTISPDECIPICDIKIEEDI